MRISDRSSDVCSSDLAQDRKIKVITRGGDNVAVALVQYSYDSVGRLLCTAQRMNPAVYASLPASACTLGTEGGFGPNRFTTNESYDDGDPKKEMRAYGRPLSQDYAPYPYSANGKRTSLTAARGYKASRDLESTSLHSRPQCACRKPP